MKRMIIACAAICFATSAAAQRNVEFGALEVPADGNIVVAVAAGDTLSGLAKEIDDRTEGALAVAAGEAQFTGEEGQTLTLYAVSPYTRVDLIGIGDGDSDRISAENFGGTAATLNNGASGTHVNILWRGQHAARVALGFQLGDYRFDRYQEDQLDKSTLGSVSVLTDDASAAGTFEDDLAHLASSVYFARNLATEPGNVIYPQSFVDRTKDAFDDVDNVRIRVLDEKEMARLGMGSHLSVGQGSRRPPRLLLVEYMAGGDAPTVALAGKGITFDTGGISLKSKDGMWLMKGDLGGAAVVTATVLAAAKREARVNVVALAALAENMPSGSASRPGDVLKSMSGKTIAINSTDAEGRLVLADAVWYAQVEYSPSVLIDVATLTGSAGRAVGNTYAALFGREQHQGLIDQLIEASAAAGEPSWQLPLDDVHFKNIEHDVADIINGGISAAGASIGASFIGSFVKEEQAWAHFDIASVDYQEKPSPTMPVGYSAWGVRALDEYLRRHHEQ